MPRPTNSLAYFRKVGALSPDDSAELERWGRHPAFARFTDADPLDPFRLYREIIRKHGKSSLEALDQQEKLILANMRLVFKLARHFSNRGVPVADLIQEGFIGLTVAVEKFDPARGYQFSTYGAWWIRSHISRAVMDQTSLRVMRVPIHHQEIERQVMREEVRLHHLNGRTPDDEDFPSGFGKKLKLIRQTPVVGASVSMDAPTRHEDDRLFGEKFSSDRYSPETLALAQSHLPRMQREIDEICGFDGGNADRNGAIIRMRYGIVPYLEPSTLQEVGKTFGVTRERVRQIIHKHLKEFGLNEKEFKRMLENLQTVREAVEASR